MRACAVPSVLALIPLALSVACAHRTPGGATVARAALGDTTPCASAGGPADSAGWERVDAGVIAFCVPRGGGVSGRVWRAAGMRLTWGVRGEQGPACWDPAVFAYRAPTWSPDPGPALAPGDDGVGQSFSETIGGRRAGVWRFRQGTFNRVAVGWSGAPRVWMCVETEVANDDQLPLRIARSVRFPTR